MIGRFILWLMLCLVVIALTLGLAFAETLRGNKASCASLGGVVVQAGEMRDAGAPWEAVQVRLMELIRDARRNPESFVQTDADEAFIVASVKSLWDRLDDPAFVVATRVFHACMGTTPASLKRVP
jgi:hypothetical protein